MVRFRRLPNAVGLPMPGYASAGAAGIDLAVTETFTVPPGKAMFAKTGFAVAIPEGYEGQIRLRSSAARRGLLIPNAPGTIDCDYRGEIAIILANISEEPVELCRGDRVAQLVVAPVARMPIVEVGELDATERGEGGFGSTGTGIIGSDGAVRTGRPFEKGSVRSAAIELVRAWRDDDPQAVADLHPFLDELRRSLGMSAVADDR